MNFCILCLYYGSLINYHIPPITRSPQITAPPVFPHPLFSEKCWKGQAKGHYSFWPSEPPQPPLHKFLCFLNFTCGSGTLIVLCCDLTVYKIIFCSACTFCAISPLPAIVQSFNQTWHHNRLRVWSLQAFSGHGLLLNGKLTMHIPSSNLFLTCCAHVCLFEGIR